MARNRFLYDHAFRPSAPVLPLRLASPLSADGVVLPALLDTGADCTLIPLSLARQLQLPVVGQISVVGVTGNPRTATLHAAHVQLPGFASLAQIGALGDESIIGRDLMNRWHVALDGPRGVATVWYSSPVRKPRRKSRPRRR